MGLNSVWLHSMNSYRTVGLTGLKQVNAVVRCKQYTVGVKSKLQLVLLPSLILPTRTVYHSDRDGVNIPLNICLHEKSSESIMTL